MVVVLVTAVGTAQWLEGRYSKPRILTTRCASVAGTLMKVSSEVIPPKPAITEQVHPGESEYSESSTIGGAISGPRRASDATPCVAYR